MIFWTIIAAWLIPALTMWLLPVEGNWLWCLAWPAWAMRSLLKPSTERK